MPANNAKPVRPTKRLSDAEVIAACDAIYRQRGHVAAAELALHLARRYCPSVPLQMWWKVLCQLVAESATDDFAGFVSPDKLCGARMRRRNFSIPDPGPVRL